MIDSHCHLTDARLQCQLAIVLARAATAGVQQMITIGTFPADNVAAVTLCKSHSNIRCAIGVHPNHCHEVQPSAIIQLREMQNDPAVVAIGEMGLDYHHKFADRKLQRWFFEQQLSLASEVGKPVVIHCREAVADCLAIMKNFPAIRADFHCFTGTLSEAKQIIEAGFYLGFTGIVTFKRSDELREIARIVPADRFFVETDAPYLSPEPMRSQKVNEPALVMHTAAAVAAVRGISVEEVDEMTTKSVASFFGF